MRTTKKELTAVFQHWLTANNVTEGHYERTPTGSKLVPGYVLDSYPAAGGYKIAYLNERGGEDEPFGQRRYSARELAAMLRFQMNCLTEKGTES